MGVPMSAPGSVPGACQWGSAYEGLERSWWRVERALRGLAKGTPAVGRRLLAGCEGC